MEILLLNKNQKRNRFDCGESALNEYLQRYALQHDRKKINKTFVGVEKNTPEKILGFYTLCIGSIDYQELPANLNLPHHAMPITRLARLGIDKTVQGKGLSEELLMHCLYRSIQIADAVGIVGVVVDAKHDGAKNFYTQYGFKELSNRPLTLFISLSEVKKSVL